MIKVYETKESKKILMRILAGDITDDDGNVVGKIYTKMDGVTPLIKIGDNLFGLDLEKFINDIFKNKDEYLKKYNEEKNEKD